MEKSALEIRRLIKRFGRTIAVEEVDLTVEQGEFCVLLGPSGCGKSTILRCIAGLETDCTGYMSIHGRNVMGLEPKDRDIAMVFQSYALYPHMSVKQNMAFPLKMSGTPKAEMEQRIKEAAAFLQIEALLQRKPKELSGGQRQRVAIGRAIVRKPKLFLFDEPLSNLDAKLRHDMRLELAKIHRELGATTIYVTHDQAEAMTLADKIVVLKQGRVEQVGSPETIYNHPKSRFVASFLGTPSMNLVRGQLQTTTFKTGGITFTVPPSPTVPTNTADEMDIGIRSEHIYVGGEDAKGRVELVEYLGSDRYAYVQCGKHRLAVRLKPTDEIAVGQTLSLGFDRPHLHFFPVNSDHH